jgi:hypothetical protein
MYFSRGPNRVQEPYTLADSYKDYAAEFKPGDLYYVTYSEYIDICSEFYKRISKSIIDDGMHFKLPYGLGEVYVIKRKVLLNNKLQIDWESTLKEGKRIYHLNEHSKGFRYSFFWTKPVHFKNRFIYRLVLTRDNKRALAKAIKQYKKDYFER